jgi:hypothetical protein
LNDQAIDGEIILRRVLREWDLNMWTAFNTG